MSSTYNQKAPDQHEHDWPHGWKPCEKPFNVDVGLSRRSICVDRNASRPRLYTLRSVAVEHHARYGITHENVNIYRIYYYNCVCTNVRTEIINV